MEIKRITAKDNPLIKRYRKLASSKKFRETENSFILEGKRLINDAYENGVKFDKLLITDSAYEKNKSEAEEMLKKIGKDFVLIDDKTGEMLSETQNTQGFFAICDIPHKYDADEILSAKKGNYMVLSRLQDPGNMGTILRTADALGIDAVFSCRSCEVFSPKTVRAAMGAAFRVKTIAISGEELFEKLKKHNVVSYAAVLAENSIVLSAETFLGSLKNAVFIGNEGNGLEKEVYEKCDKRIIIPMSENAESLNAAMAAGIFMWEMKKAGTSK